jgi:hypothetical protein
MYRADCLSRMKIEEDRPATVAELLKDGKTVTDTNNGEESK